MRKRFLTLALLTAGCAGGPNPETEVVTTQSHQRVEVSRPARLVRTAAPVAPQPKPRTPTQARRPSPRLVIQPTPQAQFFQVGPPIVINTTPSPPVSQTAAPTALPARAPAPVQATAPVQAPAPTLVQPAVAGPVPPPGAPEPVLETAPGFGYQNGGVNGTTAPLTTPSPTLPTAEGFDYRP